jgi:hypothetical protein
MAKLNQIIAVVNGKKTRTEKEYGDLNKEVQKSELFAGLSRQYQPLNDADETLPGEEKMPQKHVKGVIAQVREMLTGMMDAVATQENGNCLAKADVKVGNNVILSKVPVTVLLYLEKQLNDLHTFVGNLPTTDPAERWTWDAQNSQWRTEATRTVRTKKIQKPIVLFPATPEHPAQTQLITEDINVGNWLTTKYATSLAAKEKQDIIARIVALQDAVKVAREEANSIDVQECKIADSVLKFIFNN